MKEVLFHQDNSPAHKSVVAMAAVHDCDFELLITLHLLLIWHHLIIFCSHCPGETGRHLSVFQVVHEMSLVLIFKVLNYLSSVALSGRNQCSKYQEKVEFNACQVLLLWYNSLLVSL